MEVLERICNHYYRLAYFLHPVPEIAFQNLQEGIKIAIHTKRKVSKRPFSPEPHKIPILDEDLLHYGILKASEFFELYEEVYKYTPQKALSRYVSNYEPNTDDFLIRMLKMIYLYSFDRHPRYFAIGEGVLFYRYRVVDILSLSEDFDNQNSSQIKKFFEDKLKTRFPDLELNKDLETVDAERVNSIFQITRKSLVLPSQSEHIVHPGTNLATEYFGFGIKKGVREKQSVLMTYGIAELINDYNKCFSTMSTEKLESPSRKLQIPSSIKTKFLTVNNNFESRLDPDPLTKTEQRVIEQNLKSFPWLPSKDFQPRA